MRGEKGTARCLRPKNIEGEIIKCPRSRESHKLYCEECYQEIFEKRYFPFKYNPRIVLDITL